MKNNILIVCEAKMHEAQSLGMGVNMGNLEGEEIILKNKKLFFTIKPELDKCENENLMIFQT